MPPYYHLCKWYGNKMKIKTKYTTFIHFINSFELHTARISVRQIRRGNQEWPIKTHKQLWTKTQNENKQQKNAMQKTEKRGALTLP